MSAEDPENLPPQRATQQQLQQVHDQPQARSPKAPWRPDCSCGCLWFHPLAGDRGLDWGVCFRTLSPRAGKLTFEHDGCKYFEQNPRSR